MLYKLAAKCRGEEMDDEGRELKSNVSLNVGQDGFRPAKLFSIDRVFRNETMDATHLAEFHQVEGVVADRNLTLADLIGELQPNLYLVFALRSLQKIIGFMRVFFKKMGMTDVRFKPAYNPYTEVRIDELIGKIRL